MASENLRSTTVTGPDKVSITTIHSNPFDEVTPASVERMMANLRDDDPDLPELLPYSQMYSGRAISPDGSRQVYLVSPNELTPEDRLKLAEFELSGRWFADANRGNLDSDPA